MRILKNYIYNLSYQLFLIILPIITLPYVSRILGPEGIGINSFASSQMSYFLMVAVLGTATYGQRQIALARNSPKKLNEVFWSIEILSILVTGISFVLMLITAELQPKYSSILAIYSIAVFANIFDVSWLLAGLEKFNILAARNFIIKIISVASIFIFVKHESDMWIYITINAVTPLISNLSLIPYLKKVWPISNHIRLIDSLRHLPGTLVFFVPQVAISLYTIFNKVEMGWLNQVQAVGYFDNSDKIVRLSFTVLIASSAVVLPVLTQKIRDKNFEVVQKYINLSMQFSLLIVGLMVLGIYMAAPMIVSILMGRGFEPVIQVMRIQVFMLIPMGIANVIGNQYFVPANKMKQLNSTILFASLFNVVISFPLLSLMEQRGAAILILMSETLVALLQVLQIKREFPLNKLFYGTYKLFFAFIASLFLGLFVQQLVTTKYWNEIASVIIVVITYIGLLIVMKYPGLIFIVKKIQDKVSSCKD